MEEQFFPKEINEVLSMVSENYSEIYEGLIYLHDMTGWSYSEIAERVSRNQDYYTLKDLICFAMNTEIKRENDSRNELCWDTDISF